MGEKAMRESFEKERAILARRKGRMFKAVVFYVINIYMSVYHILLHTHNIYIYIYV